MMARVSGSPHTPSSRFIGEAFGVTAETGSSGTRATIEVDVDTLARAILAARSTTAEWKGNARATEPTRWDLIMAKRILRVLDPPAPPSAGPLSPVVADPPTPSAGLT